MQLYKILSPHNYPIISESGFKSEKEVKEIVDQTGIMNFLIGELSLTGKLKRSPTLQSRGNDAQLKLFSTIFYIRI